MKFISKVSRFATGLVALFAMNSFASNQPVPAAPAAQVSCSIRLLGQRAVNTADILRGHGEFTYGTVGVELKGFKCTAKAASAMGGDLPGLIQNITFIGPDQGQAVSLKLEDQGAREAGTVTIENADQTINGQTVSGPAYCSCAVY